MIFKQRNWSSPSNLSIDRNSKIHAVEWFSYAQSNFKDYLEPVVLLYGVVIEELLFVVDDYAWTYWGDILDGWTWNRNHQRQWTFRTSKNCNYRRKLAKVHQMVLDDRRIKMREIAEVMNMSKERVCHILNQHLGMRKLSAR